MPKKKGNVVRVMRNGIMQKLATVCIFVLQIQGVSGLTYKTYRGDRGGRGEQKIIWEGEV